MAIADGGELIVLAPGVRSFGEDEVVDAPDPPARLPRHARRARGVDGDADLAANLGAAAHLIHGCSEGRFRIVYCTDPAAEVSPPRRSSRSATSGVRSLTS